MAGSAGPAEHAEHNIMIHEEEALRIKQQIQLTTTGHLPEKKKKKYKKMVKTIIITFPVLLFLRVAKSLQKAKGTCFEKKMP